MANDERWRHDREFEDHVLESVTRSGTGYELRQHGGLVLGIDDPGWEPRAGDTARFFGRGFGYSVRGVVIFPKAGGMPLVVRYQTAEEANAAHAAGVEARNAEKRQTATADRAENDARIAALPVEFQQRIARFRAGNADFEWDHQPYELFCCEEAVKIAAALVERHAADVPAFAKLSWEQQKQLVPTLDGGHSGNTFGIAVRLAHWYLTKPENVAREHGAMVPLVGCEAYGCTHREDGEPVLAE